MQQLAKERTFVLSTDGSDKAKKALEVALF